MNQIQITVYDTVIGVGIKASHQHIKANMPAIFEEINCSYGSRFSQKLYSYLYNLRINPKCLQCNSVDTKFISFHRGYRFFCSNACVAKNQAHEAKKRSTTRQHHNCDKPSQNPEIEEQRKNTLVNRYGTSNLAKIRWKKKST